MSTLVSRNSTTAISVLIQPLPNFMSRYVFFIEHQFPFENIFSHLRDKKYKELGWDKVLFQLPTKSTDLSTTAHLYEIPQPTYTKYHHPFLHHLLPQGRIDECHRCPLHYQIHPCQVHRIPDTYLPLKHLLRIPLLLLQT